MKLKLTNFRCYSEREFNFGEDGILLLSGSSGVGKCLAKNTPILLYNGQIKTVQDLSKSDLLMGDDSRPREILSLASGTDKLYTITPNLGDPYTVNSVHILSLKSRPILFRNKDGKYRVDYLVFSKHSQKRLIRNHEILIECSTFFSTRKESLSFIQSRLDTVFDISLPDYLQLPSAIQNKLYTYHTHVNFRSRKVKISPYDFGKQLSISPQLIPDQYKFNSIYKRKQFLAGFIDGSETEIRKDHVKIASANDCDNDCLFDIKFIANSIGLISIIENNSIKIYGELAALPTKKHINIYNDVSRQRFTVSHDSIGEYYGFELNGTNRRFLLGDCTVTHNTSILMGIDFVLYGNGTKVTTIGRTSCKVELDYKNFKITRTKRPNRLLVYDSKLNEEYEDDAAQHVINNFFGSKFSTTAYLQQNAKDSFILLSPTDKLYFLESLLFSNLDLSTLKTKCQSIIKERNETLIATTAQLNLLTDQFSKTPKPEKINFPLSTNSSKPESREKAIKNAIIRYNNCKIKLKKVSNILETLQQELLISRVNETDLNHERKNLDKINEQYLTKLEEFNSIVIIDPAELEYYIKLLSYIQNNRELIAHKEKYDVDRTRLETLQKKEMEDLESELKALDSVLWQDYKKDELDPMIKEYQQLIKDTENLEKLKLEEKKYESVLDLKKEEENLSQLSQTLSDRKQTFELQKSSYECPNCNKILVFVENHLELRKDEVVDNENLEKEIEMLCKKFKGLEIKVNREKQNRTRKEEINKEITKITSQYESEIPEKSESEAILEQIKAYKRKNIELENRRERIIQKLSGKIYSVTLISLEKDLEKRRKIIADLERKVIIPTTENNYPEKNEREIIELIQNEKNNEKNKEKLEKELKEIEKEQKKIEDHLLILLSSRKENRNPEEIENDISVSLKEKEDLENNLKKLEETNSAISIYKEYEKEYTKYREQKEKIMELKDEEEEKQLQYGAALLLKEKILQSEAITLSNLITSINIHAQEYLELFFPNEPIIVRLLPFKNRKKESKDLKPQINIEVYYKEMESDLSVLSGGELSRVVLAFTLALSEISNSPIILLDECTASLDQDLTSTVLNGIRKNFSQKLTIVIAHQVISGEFDNHINLI